MIAGLSKAVTLYLSPVLMLTAILLSLFAYLAPVLILRDRVALLIITPSTGADGPSLFLGPLGLFCPTSRCPVLTKLSRILLAVTQRW
jgi:hypothetical protein